jgi:hypothetical protein
LASVITAPFFSGPAMIRSRASAIWKGKKRIRRINEKDKKDEQEG